ncbi:hypothetical protein CBR_g51242 [Chara braunii]|uniref:PHD finger protein ING n=1 Tax=Chara braunii TaxID=69332 RepID=A0A388M8A2_CHABU|nr:hypothetical protein CBR_g51242 [Chara braunii]|eukprot:GBG90735.1 hypothetical protein CBR_g51242 [Chara braunii]
MTSSSAGTAKSPTGSAPTTYLKEYMDSVASLPGELQQNFLRIRALDCRSQELHQNIAEQCTLRLEEVMARNARFGGEGGGGDHKSAAIVAERTAAIERDQILGMKLANEKVTLAMKTYDLVDGHIRRLDKDMRKLEEQLKKEREFLGDAATDMKMLAFLGRPTGDGTDGSKAAAVGEGGGAGGLSGEAGGAELGGGGGGGGGGGAATVTRMVHLDLDLPVDPNEPTYCLCNQVSYGEMIACDNPSCKIEWFHFECVGLTSSDDRPKGKWYCPTCATTMKKRKK